MIRLHHTSKKYNENLDKIKEVLPGKANQSSRCLPSKRQHFMYSGENMFERQGKLLIPLNKYAIEES